MLDYDMIILCPRTVHKCKEAKFPSLQLPLLCEVTLLLLSLFVVGLCHDLGHGPFSHVFEKELLPKLFPSNTNIVNEW